MAPEMILPIKTKGKASMIIERKRGLLKRKGINEIN